ncbi:tRNA (guanosine(37)-N1)-methyltransferase TrmD [Magnetovirga frankeli]|uniref:tRNA (guanosine(37)-N1)-methyltransferase TrmD n=1 Tax=Magnetovirga frankeli TaxID=947516 RepID=UPI001292F731|nr:tRNA (guanosine(37)-N1)-methyltransferase TrmD [gamma proteobacterium SS-5]
MRFDLISLFPDMFRVFIEQGVTGRAFKQGRAQVGLWNPRDYTSDVHRTVDDRPYGGGPGMLMKPEPLQQAIEAARQAAPQGTKVLYMSPQGQRFDQQAALRMAAHPGLILLAGRYEGIDERLITCCVDEEWSIGDYVLSGGEPAAMVIMDAVLRLLPGVLGDEDSAQQDSYMDGLLDCPHYTRPEWFQQQAVPQVLLSGNHEAIRRWRLQQSLGRTWQRRPDLLQGRQMSDEETELLNAFIHESTAGREAVT